MQVGDLELGLEVDVVLDVATDAVFGDLAVLAEQHEDRQDDRFERHRHGQQTERERVEERHAREPLPTFMMIQTKEEHHVDHEKRDAAAELGDPVGRLHDPRALVLDLRR